jgi:hypothetical protein
VSRLSGTFGSAFCGFPINRSLDAPETARSSEVAIVTTHLRPVPVAVVFVLLGSPWSPSARAEDAPAEAVAPTEAAAPAPAPEATAAPPGAPAKAPAPWGFNGTFGTGGASGDFGNLFRSPVSWEYSFFHQRGPWRIGIGYSFESFKMKDPYQDELEWGYQQLYLSGTRMFNMKGSVRPFIHVRGGLARLRPRSELFMMDPLPPDWEKGQATQKASDGFGGSVIPGVEFKLSRAAVLAASVSFDYFSVSTTTSAPSGSPPRARERRGRGVSASPGSRTARSRARPRAECETRGA